jgi:hypothetical protein
MEASEQPITPISARSTMSSYVFPSSSSSSPPTQDVSSLPSDSDDDTSTIGDEPHHSDAEREWRESLQQLELLLTMVLVPWAGKYFGRRTAYWGKFFDIQRQSCITNSVLAWAKFMQWKYPVQVVITSPSTFRLAGILETAGTAIKAAGL